MEKIEFSVVITVLNEENSIVPLLDSLIHQTLKPKEIIVVDAGSSDTTVDLIHQKLEHNPIDYCVFLKPGMNRAKARNFGTKHARFEHIAVIDAGCEADGKWLEEMAKGLNTGAQAVAGFYLPVINQPIQRLFASYVATSPDDLDIETFLPSSRSLAYTKTYWKQVDGYPNHLNTCEDLVFAVRLKQHGKMTVCPSALVYWQQANGLTAFYKQIQGYAKGDIEAGYRPHVVRILSVYARYVLFLLFPPIFLVYLVYPCIKHGHAMKGGRDGLAIPLIQLTADWAVMTGAVLGLPAYFFRTK